MSTCQHSYTSYVSVRTILSVVAAAALGTWAGLNVATAQDSEELGRYALVVKGTLDEVDHDDLSQDETCHEDFLAYVAVISPDAPDDGQPVKFETCDDGVVPNIDFHATLLDNGWALVKGTVSMTSVSCRFNNTLDPCTWPGTGTFTIKEVNQVMKPGDSLDISGGANHGGNIVNFPELKVDYFKIKW
jgi:hypothetical protein